MNKNINIDCSNFTEILSRALDIEINRIEILGMLKHICECKKCFDELKKVIKVENNLKHLQEILNADFDKTGIDSKILNTIKNTGLLSDYANDTNSSVFQKSVELSADELDSISAALKIIDI